MRGEVNISNIKVSFCQIGQIYGVISTRDRALFSTTEYVCFRNNRVLPCAAFSLHLYMLPFCALSQATINLIIPGSEMRQNVNSTVITASHQSTSWHISSSMGKQPVISLTARCITHSPAAALDTACNMCSTEKKSTLITLMENYLFTTVEGFPEGDNLAIKTLVI